MFDYYTQADSEQIRFYQLPRELVKHELFKSLSDAAKILYAILRDRVSLSIKNNWIDEEGRVYIIFTLSEMMEDLNCANQKATKSLKELQKIGLVESIRRGLGKPNIIYVKNFASGLTNGSKSSTNPTTPQTHENHDSGNVKIMNQNSLKSHFKIHENHALSILTLNHTDYSDTESESSQSQTEEKPQKPQKTKNQKTDMTKTMTTTNNNPQKPKKTKEKTPAIKPVVTHRQAGAEEKIKTLKTKIETNALRYTLEDYNSYTQIIKTNIEYDYLAQSSQSNIDLINGIIEIMLDVITTENPAIKIGKETKSREIVRSVYLKLNNEHMQYVIDRYKAQRHRIIHKNAYLRTMLFTCYQELDAHYTNAVRADGAVW